MDVSAVLVWEGALVLGVLVIRTVCLRLVDPDTIPVPLRRRVHVGTRLAPAVAALSLAMVAIGALVRIVG
jgi:hypothetical protein